MGEYLTRLVFQKSVHCIGYNTVAILNETQLQISLQIIFKKYHYRIPKNTHSKRLT